MSQKHIEQAQQRFIEQMKTVDELTVVVLKGHLLIEEALERTAGKFVHHDDKLIEADLRFAQLVGVSRSMSLDEQDNPMWQLILGLNTLRNHLAHSLDPDKRQNKLQRLKELYFKEHLGAEAQEGKHPDHILVGYAVASCLGFLAAFEAEVDRFRVVVDKMDRAINPHRHK